MSPQSACGAQLSLCNVQAIFTKHQSRQKTLLSADLPAVLAAAAPSMSCGETEFLACMLDPAGVGTLTLPSLLAGLSDSLALMGNAGRHPRQFALLPLDLILGAQSTLMS